jgi:hypothetical protein
MEQKLKDYIGGETHYTPIMNIMMNNRSKDWYAELGKYITETLDIETIPELSWLAPRLKEKKNLLTKIKDFLNDDNQVYFSVASFFLTSALDSKVLENMFGKPLLHSEFGEGFDGEYDEETDEYGEPEIKEYYASYFVNVAGTNFHIGYDHRGTGIEIQKPSKFKWMGDISDKTAEKCFESLKKLVDLYKLKN